MSFLIDAGWLLFKILSVCGLITALAGVAFFGWHFVRINAHAARGESGEVPSESWRGPGARLGLYILAGGVAMSVASMLLAAALPSRY